MVRDDRFKYVHYKDHSCELYDLQEDPDETRNLADDPTAGGEVARLRGLLVEHALENDACRAVAAQVESDWRLRTQAPSRPPGPTPVAMVMNRIPTARPSWPYRYI